MKTPVFLNPKGKKPYKLSDKSTRTNATRSWVICPIQTVTTTAYLALLIFGSDFAINITLHFCFCDFLPL